MAAKLDVIRDQAILRQASTSGKRAMKLAVQRTLDVGDQFLIKSPGSCQRHGKDTVKFQGSLVQSLKIFLYIYMYLIYEIRCGGRRTKIAHLNTLRKFETRIEYIKQLTATSEGDSGEDEISNMGAGTKLIGEGTYPSFRKEDLNIVIRDFSDTSTETASLTNVMEFGIDTGDSPPIGQSPYHIPDRLRPQVDKEIDWLLQRVHCPLF